MGDSRSRQMVSREHIWPPFLDKELESYRQEYDPCAEFGDGEARHDREERKMSHAGGWRIRDEDGVVLQYTLIGDPSGPWHSIIFAKADKSVELVSTADRGGSMTLWLYSEPNDAGTRLHPFSRENGVQVIGGDATSEDAAAAVLDFGQEVLSEYELAPTVHMWYKLMSKLDPSYDNGCCHPYFTEIFIPDLARLGPYKVNSGKMYTWSGFQTGRDEAVDSARFFPLEPDTLQRIFG